MSRTGRATLVAALLVLGSAEARADDARCIKAFEHTQQLRAAGKLRSAREEALVCSSPQCPPIASRDCAAWLLELDRITPTVVFAARDGATELLDVTVTVDGETSVRRLDGRATRIDPGPHHVRFASPGRVTVEQDIVVNEGEATRPIVARFVSSAPAPAVVETEAVTSRPVPPSVWVLGGIAVLAAAASVVFAVDGLGEKHDLDASGCKPDCNRRDVDGMTRSLLFADVLGGVAIAAAGVGVYLFVTRPAKASARARDRGLPFVLRF